MGAVMFSLHGKTIAEVESEVNSKLKEARRQGLYEDRRSKPTYDDKSEQYVVALRVHT